MPWSLFVWVLVSLNDPWALQNSWNLENLEFCFCCCLFFTSNKYSAHFLFFYFNFPLPYILNLETDFGTRCTSHSELSQLHFDFVCRVMWARISGAHHQAAVRGTDDSCRCCRLQPVQPYCHCTQKSQLRKLSTKSMEYFKTKSLFQVLVFISFTNWAKYVLRINSFKVRLAWAVRTADWAIWCAINQSFYFPVYSI